MDGDKITPLRLYPEDDGAQIESQDSRIRSLLVWTPRLDGEKTTPLELYPENDSAQIESQDSRIRSLLIRTP